MNNNNTLKKLFLLIGIFLLGFVTLYFLNNSFDKLIHELDNKTKNLEKRITIVEFIIHDTTKIRALFSELETTTSSSYARELIKKEIEELIKSIKNSLDVLEKGGILERIIKLNVLDQHHTKKQIIYTKEDSQLFVVETLDIRPNLKNLKNLMEEADTLITQKNTLKKQLDKKLKLERKIKRFYKNFPAFFTRMSENIQKLRFESEIELQKIQTEIIKDKKRYLQIRTTLFICVIFIVFILGYIIARNINRLNLRLNKNLDKLHKQQKHIRAILDSQKNIIVVTNGRRIKDGNKMFFDFLGFKDLTAFFKEHECICEYFIENDKFFHLGKIDENQNWINEIVKLPEPEQVVAMMDKDYKLHAFSVSVNIFSKNFQIVSFTDITQTIKAHMKLEGKIIRDKLTGAYNREFFEKNYKKLLSNYHSSDYKFAIALLDIDHFKSVNDTFGHDIGDSVLIEFVNTVHRYSRRDDVLVRWGGEEFILILKVSSDKDLKKALEHVRKATELQHFTTVKNITCSIGTTIYKSKEDISTTIKRADEAVYEAKEKGRNQVVIKL